MSKFASRLLYQHNDEWLRVPNWVTYYAVLGSKIAGIPIDQRTILALSLPTYSYCTAFVSVGLIIARSLNAQSNPESHIDLIESLSPDHPVLLYRGNSVYDGFYIGRMLRDNNVFYGVKVHEKKCNTTFWVPLKNLESIKPQHVRIQNPRNKKRRFINSKQTPRVCKKKLTKSEGVKNFIQQAIHGSKYWKFVTENTMDCTIIGKIRKIRKEVLSTSFRIEESKHTGKNGFCTGKLNDIIRIRRFLTKDVGYHSEILSYNHWKLKTDQTILTPHAVIFDGSTAFLKWRHKFPKSHWVAILDRTEYNFFDAAAEVNQEYILRRNNAEHNDFGIDPPPTGIEVLMFQE